MSPGSNRTLLTNTTVASDKSHARKSAWCTNIRPRNDGTRVIARSRIISAIRALSDTYSTPTDFPTEEQQASCRTSLPVPDPKSYTVSTSVNGFIAGISTSATDRGSTSPYVNVLKRSRELTCLPLPSNSASDSFLSIAYTLSAEQECSNRTRRPSSNSGSVIRTDAADSDVIQDAEKKETFHACVCLSLRVCMCVCVCVCMTSTSTVN